MMCDGPLSSSSSSFQVLGLFRPITNTTKTRDSSVGIATGFELDDRSLVPGRVRVFSLLHSIQKASWGHPAYPLGTGGCFPVVKRLGREADHSFPSSADVKKTWIYTSTPPYAFLPYSTLKSVDTDCRKVNHTKMEALICFIYESLLKRYPGLINKCRGIVGS
jgi:hypothetical protein